MGSTCSARTTAASVKSRTSSKSSRPAAPTELPAVPGLDTSKVDVKARDILINVDRETCSRHRAQSPRGFID